MTVFVRFNRIKIVQTGYDAIQLDPDLFLEQQTALLVFTLSVDKTTTFQL